ncbi:hypothetical protein F5050DRAFT_1809863 [Lentinula boryana]|uniref:Uncharacterized protein n=1 Tax=Lentinula boryana TaxID=40481 RepID=A0ABQ8Q6N1_9AGAR|nr:hypothetical protein F5050DRAFT_1809863 [Lentinula boryana]
MSSPKKITSSKIAAQLQHMQAALLIMQETEERRKREEQEAEEKKQKAEEAKQARAAKKQLEEEKRRAGVLVEARKGKAREIEASPKQACRDILDPPYEHEDEDESEDDDGHALGAKAVEGQPGTVLRIDSFSFLLFLF